MSRLKYWQIRVTNPYFEKDNNCYVLDAGELALIDTSIDTPEAFAAIEQGVSSFGRSLTEISKIFLTHKHLDHFGLAHRIRAISGATVYIHQDDHADVAHYEARHEMINELYDEKMHQWGIPSELIDMLSMRSALVMLGRSVPATVICDKEVIPIGDTRIEAIHTPGHTQGSVCYGVDDLLFTGDHVLPTYTPNIGATEVTSSGMLRKYRASLQKISEWGDHMFLPGHGDCIADPRARIREILEHHVEREALIIKILEDRKPMSVFEIAQALFGTLKDHHTLLGAGEVSSHLESMEEEKQVAAVGQNLYALA